MIKFLKKWIEKIWSNDKIFEIFHGGNPSALNILILTEYINATYFISFDIPLLELHKERKINFAVASQKWVAEYPHWSKLADGFCPDVVIMTRYGEFNGRRVFDGFRQRGIPIIYHIDDDLLEIPESLGVEIQKRQGSNEVVETRRYLLQNCDLIYTSTSILGNLMQRRFPEQKLVHGIYAPYMGPNIMLSEAKSDPGAIIGYMASKGHQHDLEMILPAIERLLTERIDLKFEVFGTIRMPNSLKRFGDRVRSHSVKKSYSEFLSNLASLGWTIGLAPLNDEPFNHCKAPTKYIEYTACGIAVAASRIPVYEEAIPPDAGLLVENDWYEGLAYLLDNPKQREDYVLAARRHCENKFALDLLKTQLLTIVESVVKRNANGTS